MSTLQSGMVLVKALGEIGPLQRCNIDVLRIVETQEYAATTSLVDNLEEQDLLERLLDEVKPAYREDTQALHYLISTPFRYPPLKHGSRFGDVTMPSYFYASEDIETALSECAFYRFVFLYDMAVPYNKAVNSEHMSFSVNARSTAMADLTQVSSKDIMALLISPTDYGFTQQLGRVLTQEKKAKVIKFRSARASGGINIAISEPPVITSPHPQNNTNWICHSSRELISFNSHGCRPISFNIDAYLVDGLLPRPA